MSTTQPTPQSQSPSFRYRFLFRARIIGIFEWICPACGTNNRSRMRPTGYVVRCRKSSTTDGMPVCALTWGVGHVLHELPTGPRIRPEDYLIPAGIVDAFPEGDAGKHWRTGMPMHCVHTAMGTLAVPDSNPSTSTIAPNVSLQSLGAHKYQRVVGKRARRDRNREEHGDGDGE